MEKTDNKSEVIRQVQELLFIEKRTGLKINLLRKLNHNTGKLQRL